jgi:hypothetical protein
LSQAELLKDKQSTVVDIHRSPGSNCSNVNKRQQKVRKAAAHKHDDKSFGTLAKEKDSSPKNDSLAEATHRLHRTSMSYAEDMELFNISAYDDCKSGRVAETCV